MTFEKQLKQAIEQSMVERLRIGDWLKVDWNDRVPLKQSVLQGVYESLDWRRIQALVLDDIEKKVADAIIGKMATEIGTDIKKIMSNQELREDLRATLRTKMREAVQ